jgi:hypothetical protein
MELGERALQTDVLEQSVAPVSAGFIAPAPPTAVERKRIQASDAVDLRDVVIPALAIIDRVHVAGALPKIPVHNSYNASRPSAGGFVSREGVPISIDVNTYKDFAPSAMLTFIHEIGHFLDLSAFGKAGVFATLAGDAMFDGWRRAVEATDAVQNLRRRKDSGTVVVHTAQGPIELSVSNRHLEYLLTDDELWARSYAQYIAERSVDATLLAALNFTRPPAVIGQLYPAQWDPADFAPVATAIDTLFRGLGWLL